MEDRDPELQRLIDEAAIRRLLARYPRAWDRHDEELLASLYHPDAIDDHGHYNGPWQGYLEYAHGRWRDGFHWMHHNGTQIIELEGDVAYVETYCLAFYREPPADGGPADHETFLRVRYLDRVERRNGEWRIAHRRVVYSPSHILPVAKEVDLPDTVLWEAGSKDDPVYHWPGRE
jgi:ketosteroid isomerase-like protein